MNNSKSFLITIDTESDNQWDVKHPQTTYNSKYIPRFQELCEKYDFKPVYLTDYSMAQDSYFVNYIKSRASQGKCEIGMHLHAWNTPPFHEFDQCKHSRPFLIEYPQDVMCEKIHSLHRLLIDKFERTIQSHRAGRWMINTSYLNILSQIGYTVDCSITPGIDWSKSFGVAGMGLDYTNEKDTAHFVGSNYSILEIPMTLQRIHTIIKPRNRIDYLKEPIKMILGRSFWLRPALSSNQTMLHIMNDREQDYAEFMMHSSELMPGGSPYFSNAEDIENLYNNLEVFFKSIKDRYTGRTLVEYYELKKKC